MNTRIRNRNQKVMMSIPRDGSTIHDIVQRNTYEFLTPYGTCLQAVIVSSFVHLAAAAAAALAFSFSARAFSLARRIAQVNS